ncbi:CCA tRNA nucleotidyltransferase [Paenisporosarcina sp. OV554]|uniref:CCA tRNA nucleotidyltransferase n=1 Tax=Paenisporosarcina sp. OV554 TaxID=2135694 RepID=UPI000D332ADE|nr:CCA tRNA nucleotidyltransferase [Paenisporosarcina sp. OV554]PUB10313.1 tRNA nucleotidyltransferase (CCA-adding enzyme) [Paenisporosarcina sp. OV554]
MFTTEQWQAGKKIIETLIQHGYEAVFVGGAVRDFVRHKIANDIDIATSALPSEVKFIFKRTVDLGLAHGTVLVIENHVPIEVTTFRTEGEYTDHRRPSDVKFVLSLEEDLKRRDFTMNALAMTANFHLIDLFDGQRDLHNGIIRTVGEPTDRFKEDALRMLRAVRFTAQLGFSIDSLTLDAIKLCSNDLAYVSVERLTAELEKMWLSKHLGKGMSYLGQSNLAKHLPGDFQFEDARWKYLGNPQNVLVCWSFLCLLQEIPNGSDLATIFKLSNELKQQINHLVNATQIRCERLFTIDDLYHFEENILVQAELLSRVLCSDSQQIPVELIVQRKQSLPIQSFRELVISGQDVMEWLNKPGGPWLKDMLSQIEHAVLHQKVANNATKLKEWIMNESNSEV